MTKSSPKQQPQEKLRRIAIDPISRVEGHGKITLLLDENQQVQQARLHIVEFRGFEQFIQGRPYWELPVLVQRLCGICPVSHHLAAAKAIDQLVGVDPGSLPPSAEKLRRLLHYGQVMQSHALHFFHLASPDLLFGFTAQRNKRNVFAVLKEHPELALQGIKIRKYGQEVIRMITGKRIHGIAAIPGGMNKALTVEDRRILRQDIDNILQWSATAVELIKEIHCNNLPYFDEFAEIQSNFLSLTDKQGALELYHGGLTAKTAQGDTIFENVDTSKYLQYIHEEVKPWSYMKFPFFVALGSEKGWYRVGPLARINNCRFITTPLAEQARQEFKQRSPVPMVQSTLAYHWARLIEGLHCAELIKNILQDDELSIGQLATRAEKRSQGIGVIEAPRGTLIHHYLIDENDLVRKANLIVSTTNNNQAMNESVRQVANTYLSGHELNEALLNNLEVAIRAYDPCLSCATHAVGKMPLHIQLLDHQGQLLDELSKNSNGTILEKQAL